eukprot:TRINITY_DN14502_c0_g1_i1.p2 TRINITY_DN14502_c0_g1~~TRINITY_DN14502_c0_g1_i1.p2  ORF type:complete len:104 (+),score=10.62 TRINITY_DN14502_c0_g1_i1:66-377(+)
MFFIKFLEVEIVRFFQDYFVGDMDGDESTGERTERFLKVGYQFFQVFTFIYNFFNFSQVIYYQKKENQTQNIIIDYLDVCTFYLFVRQLIFKILEKNYGPVSS